MTAVGEQNARTRHWIAPRPGPTRLGNPTRRRWLIGSAKYVAIAAALGLIGAVVAWPKLQRDEPEFVVAAGPVEPAGTDMKMLSARYSGRDQSGRLFTITAEEASQDPDDRRRIRLKDLQADITLKDGTWLSLKARSGDYQQRARTLRLAGSIDIYVDNGYELHTDSVFVDLERGLAQGDGKVWGQGPLGNIEAGRFTIGDFGRVVRFSNGVRLTVLPDVKG